MRHQQWFRRAAGLVAYPTDLTYLYSSSLREQTGAYETLGVCSMLVATVCYSLLFFPRSRALIPAFARLRNEAGLVPPVASFTPSLRNASRRL